jgi:adenylylsulfate kinase
MGNNIHPIFDRLLQKSDRERQLNQRAKVLWLTGLSGSGKSTIALHLERKLYNNGFFCTGARWRQYPFGHQQKPQL